MSMKAVFSASLAILACTPAAAQPQPDPMAGYYGATLTIVAKGFKQQRFFEPDHSFRDRSRGKVTPGTWAIEGDKICTQEAGGSRFCNLGLGKTAGESWVDHDPYTGNEVKFSLVEGRKADR